jgi:XRE family aerobic/anaerobic benzoate catabolism transcriptional regulator
MGLERIMLRHLGELLRGRREASDWTQGELARTSGVSLRLIAQLEAGQANVSLLRLAAVAEALGATAGELISDAEARACAAQRGPMVALLGVRGAGKSTIGAQLAARLGVPFFELDALIERAASLPLRSIFELHGEAYYRRLERESLARLLATEPAAVVATGGSIVTSRESYRLLRRHFWTVWLRARAEDHWNRVVAQGDARPMANKPHAMAELRALLDARAPLYAQVHEIVDTSRLSPTRVVAELARGLGASRQERPARGLGASRQERPARANFGRLEPA